MQVGTSPKWLYSIGSHQETHVFWLHYNFGYSLVILQEKHENQLWQDAEIVFLPLKLHGPRIFTYIYHTFPRQKVGEPFPFDLLWDMLPSFACHRRLCMEPIHQSFRKLRQEMEEREASPFPLGYISGKNSAWRRGKKHVWTNWGWIWRLFIFSCFFAKLCLFVCEMGILLFFSISDKDFREPLIQMMLYDWVLTGVATENWYCSFLFKCLRYILSLD